jgi:hypothetical protein
VSGLTATGVIVRVRDTGAEYGMHDGCADALVAQLVSVGYSPIDDDMPAVIIGPLFADAGAWTCAHSGCALRAEGAQL